VRDKEKAPEREAVLFFQDFQDLLLKPDLIPLFENGGFLRRVRQPAADDRSPGPSSASSAIQTNVLTHQVPSGECSGCSCTFLPANFRFSSTKPAKVL